MHLSFNDLTGPGRMRRLRPLAIAALTNWDVNPLSVRPLAQSVNAMFRVDADDGQRYVLHVFQAGQKDMDDRPDMRRIGRAPCPPRLRPMCRSPSPRAMAIQDYHSDSPKYTG